MTDPVLIRHPSPVRYVPQGGRVTRWAYEALETPVRLREADPGAFGKLPLGKDATSAFWRGDAYVHEEALWRRVIAWDPVESRSRPVHPDVLRAFLGGEAMAPHYEKALTEQFVGTPVLAGLWHPYADEPPKVERGDPAWPVKSSAPEHDRARAALERFLDRDLRVDGERAWLRATPLAQPTGDGSQERPCGWDHHSRLRIRAGRGIAVRPDRAAEAAEATALWGSWGRRRFPPGPDAIPPAEFIGDDDIEQLANQAPAFFCAYARHAIAHATRHPGRHGGHGAIAEAKRAAEAMLPYAMRGRIGSIPRSEAEEVLAAVTREAGAIDAIGGYDAAQREQMQLGLLPLVAHIRL